MALTTVLASQLALYLGGEGSELCAALTTGNYTLGTGWTYGTNPNRIEKLIDGTGTVTPVTQSITAGQTYKVIITVDSLTASSASWTLGGVAGNNITAAGTYVQYIVASTTGKLIITPVATGLRMVISDLSVKQVTSLKTVAFATEFGIDINKTTVDVTTLASSGWKQFLVDLKEWKISFSGLSTRGTPGASETGSEQLILSMVGTDTPFTIIVKSAVSLDQYVIGQGLLTSLKESGSTGDAKKFTGELQGTSVFSLLYNA